MKLRHCIAAALGGMLGMIVMGITPRAYAQAAQDGIVRGRISNESTGQYLNQAEVRIENTNLVATTDAEGFFSISRVPPGIRTIVVNYVGLPPAKYEVVAEAGKTVRADYAFGTNVLKLDQFVVSTVREGMAAAANVQRAAESMKTVLSADAFGSLYDNNAGELLKAIPGITLNYGGEDPTSFEMRGQNSAYATVSTDGMPMPSVPPNDSTNRGMNFRNVTVNNIETIEVNRAPTAAQPANSMGGSINFVTRSAFSQTFRRLSFSAGFNVNTDGPIFNRTFHGSQPGYGSQHTTFPSAALNYSDTFRKDTDHPIGIAFNATLGGRYVHNSNLGRSYAYDPLPAGQTRIPASTGVNLNTVTFREASAGWRQVSYNLNLEYKLNESTALYFRSGYQTGPQYYVYGFNNTATFTTSNTRLGNSATGARINGNDENHVDSRRNATPVGIGSATGSRVQKTSGSEGMINAMLTYSAGGRYRKGNLSGDFGTYYTRAYDDRDPKGYHFGGPSNQGSLTYVLNDISYTIDSVQNGDSIYVQQTAGPDWRDASNYSRLSWSNGKAFRLDKQWGGQFNLKAPVSRLPFPFEVQTGGSYGMQYKLNTEGGGPQGNQNYIFGTGPDRAWGTADDVPLPMRELISDGISGWNLNGPAETVNPGTWLDPYKVFQYGKAHPEAMIRNSEVTDVTDKFAKREFLERIMAVYLMGTAKFGKLSFVPGVRWEQTTGDGKGFSRNQTLSPIPANIPVGPLQVPYVERQYAPIRRKSQYDDFYLNLQANYRFTPDLIARTAYTETIGRPNFGQLLPGDTINDTSATVSRNNPDLEPFTAKNYDIAGEYYFAKGTANVMVGAFRKEISNYTQNVQSTIEGGADNGFDGKYEGYILTQAMNIPETTVSSGYEFSYRHSFRSLPSYFSNLTFSSSYTHLKSTPRQGQSVVTGVRPHVVFAGLTYSGLKWRADIKYNWRKAWITQNNDTTGLQTWHTDDPRWDFAFDYKFAPRWQFNFNWRNITKQGDTTTVFGRPVGEFRAGMLMNIAVKWTMD